MTNVAVDFTRSFICNFGPRVITVNSLSSKHVRVQIGATDRVLALQFHIKRTRRSKQSEHVGKWPKLTASLSENVISRPQMEQSNKDELASLQEALASTRDSKRGSTFKGRNNHIQDTIQRAIFDCRLLTLMAVAGSLAGSVLCFIKGCFLVLESFSQYFYAFWHRLDFGQIIVLLVESIDVYLMGTVMLIFGMGLYELFISNLQEPSCQTSQGMQRELSYGSNLFGLFHFRGRPQWLEIHSLEELKTKIGHVIVMLLLVGLFEKSKRLAVSTGLDMVCFSASIFLASASIFLLSKLSVK